MHPCESDNLTYFIRYCPQRIRVNINASVPEYYAIPIYGYVTPIIVAITFVTNTFIVIVLSQKHLRTPTNYVLLAMAITELFTGLCPIPWFIYYYTLQGYLLDRLYGLPMFWCKYHDLFAKTLPTICHSAAVWLTVYLAIQRYVYVCMPSLAPKFCSYRRTKVIVFLLCMCAVIFEVPSIFAYSRESYTWGRLTPEYNTTYQICTKQYAPWLRNSSAKDHYQLAYYWIQILLVHFIPCILLSIYSSLLIRTMRVADRRRESLFSGPTPPTLNVNLASTSDSHRSALERVSRRLSLSSHMGASMRQFQATTKMLICVILIFLLIEIPAGIIFILHTLCASIPPLREYLDYRYFNIALIFRNLLIMISYPINFAIYCGMSQQFRLTVKQLFSRQVLFIQQPSCAGSGTRKRFSVVLLDVKGFKDRRGGSVKSLSSRRTTGCSSRVQWGSIPEENEETKLSEDETDDTLEKKRNRNSESKKCHRHLAPMETIVSRGTEEKIMENNKLPKSKTSEGEDMETEIMV